MEATGIVSGSLLCVASIDAGLPGCWFLAPPNAPCRVESGDAVGFVCRFGAESRKGGARDSNYSSDSSEREKDTAVTAQPKEVRILRLSSAARAESSDVVFVQRCGSRNDRRIRYTYVIDVHCSRNKQHSQRNQQYSNNSNTMNGHSASSPASVQPSPPLRSDVDNDNHNNEGGDDRSEKEVNVSEWIASAIVDTGTTVVYGMK